jgi:hypothetical protein
MLGDNDRNRRRKTVAIYNEVEKLNKHPSVFVNYLRVLVEGKGMEFVIDDSSDEDDGNTVKPKNYKLASIMEADDITHDKFEELTAKKKVGKTTLEENFQVDRHFMQKHLSVKELDEATVNEHMFNPDLLKNFLSLIDTSNYQKQDNVKSVNHVEKVELVHKLLNGLGFESPTDADEKDMEKFMNNFRRNICKDPVFQNKKRINELWELRKQTAISTEMNRRQILTWVGSLLKPFSLKLKPSGSIVSLEVENDVLGIIKRRNEQGKFYQDARNLLRQESEDGDPFIDEATGETLIEKQEKKREQRMMDYDTSGLDVGVRDD